MPQYGGRWVDAQQNNFNTWTKSLNLKINLSKQSLQFNFHRSVSTLQRVFLIDFGEEKKWWKGLLPSLLYNLNIGNPVAAIPYHLAHCCVEPLPESHIVLGKLRAEGGWGVSVSNPQTFLKIASQKFPHVVTKIVYHHLRGSKISTSKDKLPMPYELLSLHIANSINISQNSSSIFTCVYVCAQAWHFFSFRL